MTDNVHTTSQPIEKLRLTNALTLDDLFADIKSAYSSLDFDLPGGTLELRNPFSLSGDDRAELTTLQKSLRQKDKSPEVNDEKGEDESDEDYEARLELEEEAAEAYGKVVEARTQETIRKIIRVVANDQTLASVLLDAIGENTAGLMVLLQKYTKAVQVGEA